MTPPTHTQTDPVHRIVRMGVESDLDYIVALMSRLNDSVGFCPRGAIAERIETRRIVVVEENGEPAGYVNFTNRRDRTTHISQVAVDPAIWRTTAGTSIVSTILRSATQAGSQLVTLRSALDLPANDFWPTVGFEDVGGQRGQKRWLICWVHRLGITQRDPDCPLGSTLFERAAGPFASPRRLSS